MWCFECSPEIVASVLYIERRLFSSVPRTISETGMGRGRERALTDSTRAGQTHDRSDPEPTKGNVRERDHNLTLYNHIHESSEKAGTREAFL